ncbi:hypothetical protein [Brevibacillus sp. SAFN-007a]|uniref:hypothetical protein n=1 Tax=Brevibacillus sp. SAFN-007a TaxID=3436862 RepID=UPI003F7F8B30
MFYQKLGNLSRYPDLSADAVNTIRVFLEKMPMNHRTRFNARYLMDGLHWDKTRVHRALDALVKENILVSSYEVLCPECSYTCDTVTNITNIPHKVWCSECEKYVFTSQQDVWVFFRFEDSYLTIGMQNGTNSPIPSSQVGDDDVNSFFLTTPSFASNQYCRINLGEFKSLYEAVRAAKTNDQKKHALENMAEYLVSSIVGFIPSGRDSRATTGEIDRTFRNDANYHPVLSAFGPFIQIECKHVAAKLNPAEIGDFARVMNDIDASTGLYFTMKGVTGNTNRDGWAAILNESRHNRRRILVFEEEHYKRIEKGEDFLTMVFEEYQKVRMLLAKDFKFPAGVQITDID